MPKSKNLYSQTPVVPAKQIAGTNPFSGVELGSAKPKMVPQKQPSIHGFDTPAHTFKTASIKGSHGYGHVGKLRQGSHRMSGTPGSHRVGKK